MTSPDDESILEFDSSTVYTPTATSRTPTTHTPCNSPQGSNVPTHASTFIIRNLCTGHLLTLLGGQLLLSPPGSRGSIHWACEELDGWMTFQNCVSDKFVCFDGSGMLKCNANQGDKRRLFSVTPVEGGGCFLQMVDWFTLCSVVIVGEKRNCGGRGKWFRMGLYGSFGRLSSWLHDLLLLLLGRQCRRWEGWGIRFWSSREGVVSELLQVVKDKWFISQGGMAVFSKS